MHYNVMIVDDEVLLSCMTAKYFNALGIATLTAADGPAAISALKSHEIDLILLDINLAKGESGFDLCRTIRCDYDTPIFFMSARDTSADMLVALSIGGDDYITKPCDLGILAAKIKARLKRKESRSAARAVSAGRIQIDLVKMKAFLDGRDLDLKIKEFKLLAYFAANPNRVVSKDEILYEVWGDTYISDNALNVQVSRLREKIEKDPLNPDYIKTVWGQGYLFEVKE